MPLQGRLHEPSLNPFAPSMYQPDFLEACRSRSRDVFVHDRCNFAWRERMKVDLRLDRNVVHAS